MADTQAHSRTPDSKVSFVVHTRNSEKVLEKALGSISWADEIIVVDMDSSDGTVDIARRHKARIMNAPTVSRVDGIRNRYLETARNNWIFVLDSDEYLANDAEENIAFLLSKHGSRYDAFAIPRYNTIAGQVMRGSGWYPAPQIRLFRKGSVRWIDGTHRSPEVVTGAKRLLELEPPDCLHIHHENYENLRHVIRKQLEYALHDRYESDPDLFDYSDYVAKAYERLAFHSDPERDGSLSKALAIVMAWDALMRGLIHWDTLDRSPPLDLLAALPPASGKIPRYRIFLRKWLGRRHSLRYALRNARYWFRRIFRF